MIRSLKYTYRPLFVVLALIISLVASTLTVGANPARWRMEGWTKTDFNKTSIDFQEILSGGPPKDGIPSIDKPKFVPLADVTGLSDTEPVIGLEINGDARAYPLQILIWHEIVNDKVGGTPVTVTYCPLCNSAIVFDRRFDGKILDFGTTVAFLVAPVIAVLNHRAVFGDSVPLESRPGRGMWMWSMIGIVAFISFTVTYFFLMFAGYLD